MFEAIALSYILAFTCPTFNYELDPAFNGWFFIGDGVFNVPIEQVSLTVRVLKWTPEVMDFKEFDSLACYEGQEIDYEVPPGIYKTTWQFRGGEMKYTLTEQKTFSYRCGDGCHQ